MHLETHRCALVLIDIQEKLLAVMHNQEALLKGLNKITAGAKVLGIPILWNEQNPDRMGPTVASIQQILHPLRPLGKMHFSCCGNEDFMSELESTGRDQILLAGIETHVCVFQTAQQLIQQHYNVQIVADAVSSRNPIDQDIALQRITHTARLQQAQLSPLTTSESALFELMQTADHPNFRDILKVIR